MDMGIKQMKNEFGELIPELSEAGYTSRLEKKYFALER